MKTEFKIQIEDDSSFIPEFIVESNTSSVDLYDWQRRAIDYFFNSNFKCIFEVASGSGKTFCSIQIIKKIWEFDEDANVLIVVPKNVILEDTWFRELYNNGISLTQVGVFYGNIKEISKVTITNMQNLDRINLDIFDMIILDECHNYGTKRLLPYIRKEFKYKIGLSATLERMDDAHYKILKIFNYNVFKYTPKQALNEGVLNPFNFYNVAVEMDEETRDRYDTLTQEINSIMMSGGGFKKIMRSSTGLKLRMLSKMTERKELVNNYNRKFDIVKIICDKHRADKIIVFNEYNEQTSRSYWYLLDIGVRACIVHSTMPKEKREQNMIDFRNDRFSVILASRVLDEGYNLPKIDTAIIAAGNSTAKQTIQRMGRVLRRKKHHSNLFQVYCLETVEEQYALERAKMFKELCSNHKEYVYRLDEEFVL